MNFETNEIVSLLKEQLKSYDADIDIAEVGEITYINDQTPQHLFVVKSNGKEILIPINDDFILDLDRINKIINLKIPEGLLKIYK